MEQQLFFMNWWECLMDAQGFKWFNQSGVNNDFNYDSDWSLDPIKMLRTSHPLAVCRWHKLLHQQNKNADKTRMTRWRTGQSEDAPKTNSTLPSPMPAKLTEKQTINNNNINEVQVHCSLICLYFTTHKAAQSWSEQRATIPLQKKKNSYFVSGCRL